jgi:hypothetical protein
VRAEVAGRRSCGKNGGQNPTVLGKRATYLGEKVDIGSLLSSDGR